MICKKCGDKMDIIQIDGEYQAECNCGYLIN